MKHTIIKLWDLCECKSIWERYFLLPLCIIAIILSVILILIICLLAFLIYVFTKTLPFIIKLCVVFIKIGGAILIFKFLFI